MNLIQIMEKFPDQMSCINFLEEIRFKDGAYCPLCGSTHVNRKTERKIHVGRWNCYDCKASFKAVQGTMFHGTKIPLQKWFLSISLMVNAKKSLSSHQLSRDLGLPQKTAWFMMTRIRAEMASKNDVLLQGIIEADETYIGGKPRKRNKHKEPNEEPAKRGRGTKKTAVIGVVARGGYVVAEPLVDISGKGILQFILNSVNPENSTLITDEYKAYKRSR